MYIKGFNFLPETSSFKLQYKTEDVTTDFTLMLNHFSRKDAHRRWNSNSQWIPCHAFVYSLQFFYHT